MSAMTYEVNTPEQFYNHFCDVNIVEMDLTEPGKFGPNSLPLMLGRYTSLKKITLPSHIFTIPFIPNIEEMCWVDENGHMHDIKKGSLFFSMYEDLMSLARRAVSLH